MDSLFDWQEIEEITPEYYEFDHCVLKRSIGGLPIGARVPKIAMNFEEAEISFFDSDDEETWTGVLRVTAAGDDLLSFVGGSRPTEVNILVFNYAGPVVLRAPFDVFQKGRTLKNVLIDYARGDVEVETLDGRLILYPLCIRA